MPHWKRSRAQDIDVMLLIHFAPRRPTRAQKQKAVDPGRSSCLSTNARARAKIPVGDDGIRRGYDTLTSDPKRRLSVLLLTSLGRATASMQTAVHLMPLRAPRYNLNMHPRKLLSLQYTCPSPALPHVSFYAFLTM